MGLGIPLDYLLSLVIVTGWFVVASIATGNVSQTFLYGCLPLLFPLALIWFSEAIGEFTGILQLHRIRESPPILVRIAGWMILFALIWFQTREIFGSN